MLDLSETQHLQNGRDVVAEPASIAFPQSVPAADRVVLRAGPCLDCSRFGFFLLVCISEKHPVSGFLEHGVKVLDASELVAQVGRPHTDPERCRVSFFVTPCVELGFARWCGQDPWILSRSCSFNVIHDCSAFPARSVGLYGHKHDTIWHLLSIQLGDMSAGRLLNLLLLLQNNEQLTASQIAEELEISRRTVLRDIEALSSAGVPIYSVRGREGGFRMLHTFNQSVPAIVPGLKARRGQLRRVRVRLSPAALQLAVMYGRPEGWRKRPTAEPPADRPEWVEGSFRFDSYDSAIRELLSLGPEVEVLLPVEMRQAMATVGRRIATRHR